MRRHPFDIFSFVFGTLFIGLGVAYLVNDGRWRFDAGPWVWPAVLLVGGTVILVATLRDDRSRRQNGSAAIDGQETGVAEIDVIDAPDIIR